MPARWLTAAGVHAAATTLALVVAGVLWGHAAPAPAIAATLGIVAVAAGLAGAGAGRPSIGVLAGTALVAPMFAVSGSGDAYRTLVASALWLGPGLLALDGTLRWRGRAGAAGVAVAITSALGLGAHLLFLDSFQVIDCAPFCRPNSFVIAHRPEVGAWARIVATIAVGVWAVASVRSATTRRRIVILAGCALSWTVLASFSWIRVLTATTRWDRLLLLIAGACFVVIVGEGVALDARQVLLRRRIRSASRVLGTEDQPRRAELLLGDALRDTTVRVAYPLPEGRRVDADGVEVTLPERMGREPVRLMRREQLVAVLATDADRDVVTALTPQLIIAIENEGLLARTRALLADLRQSRQRLVASAEEERHRLERDLHDGTQQRLLAIMMLLAGDDQTGGERRDVARAEASRTLVELRRIARGLYPVSLDRLGLPAALQSYLDEAPVAVELELGGLDTPLSPSLERVVYRVVRTYVEQAARDGATIVAVNVRRSDGEVSISLEHDGRSAGDTTDIEDRVGAVGGRWVTNGFPGRQSAEAVLPCE